MTKKEAFRAGDALDPYAQRLANKGIELLRGLLRSNGLKYKWLVKPNADHVDRIRGEIRGNVSGAKVETDGRINRLQQDVVELEQEFKALTSIQVEGPKNEEPEPAPEAYDLDVKAFQNFLQTLKTKQHEGGN